jgi:hypothetical protein
MEKVSTKFRNDDSLFETNSDSSRNDVCGDSPSIQHSLPFSTSSIASCAHAHNRARYRSSNSRKRGRVESKNRDLLRMARCSQFPHGEDVEERKEPRGQSRCYSRSFSMLKGLKLNLHCVLRNPLEEGRKPFTTKQTREEDPSTLVRLLRN